MKSRTITITIERDAQSVYRFASNLGNLPKWAPAFVRSIEKKNGQWIAQTSDGPVEFKMAPENAFGVLDHTVIPAPGVHVHVPMRVVPAPSGCEVLFTLFQLPQMTDRQFARDQELVERDLQSLKKIVEQEG